MSRPPKITPEKKAEFIELLAQTGNVSKCCEALEVTRTRMYMHRNKNKTFRKQWAMAKKLAVARLEDEAWRRAFEGVEKPVFYKGEQLKLNGKPYFERNYSDTLLMHRLNAERPDKYHYRQQIDGKVDGEITVKVVKFSNEPK